MTPLHHRLAKLAFKRTRPLPMMLKLPNLRNGRKKHIRPKLIPGVKNCGEVPRKTTDVPEKTGETKSSKKVKNSRGRKNRICQVGVFQFYLRESEATTAASNAAQKNPALVDDDDEAPFLPLSPPRLPDDEAPGPLAQQPFPLQHLSGRRVSATPGCYPVIHRVIRGYRSRLI